ncbi:substrate-binding periplasmic protein [Metapseudomonas furukawaii]|uniref:Solute-binding protein family 3/N-terminal domain-containing protein n=1 Tax=Metapseudomonas furukawaii TaxID=1149133 RepID=A0AAD1FGK9_METFU|nr:transporter substrate-binding domain-containing protein [Pseudomonas furukawaii]ELS24017.1 Hypothetical protein ppKF707_4861 [Pseudomonas furukawaii]BAU75297.1 hypothetical protein KF707C_36090 [Pseudomonas furukawaii]
MRSFVLALLLCWSALTGAAPATLKFSAVDSWTMPLADFHDSQLKGGILNDIIQRLSQRLGLDASVQVLPRNRVELAARQGSIDVRCYVSPAWISDHQRFLWSVPLFLHRDLIVARRGEAPLPTPEALSGEQVGTVLGYSYPRLQPLIDRGAVRRDEARNQDLVLQKLLAGRYQYAISNEQALNWFNRNHPDSDQLTAVGILEETPVACLVRDDPDLPTQRILRALQQMKTSGEIEAILARYR